MDFAQGALIGAIAGAHIATWGMYKDAPHEGFTWPKYFRGIVLGGSIGALAAPLSGLALTRADHIVVFFGAVYGLERAAEEFYKTFLREEDQRKYYIPMQLHVRGRVVRSRGARWGAAAAYLAGVLLITAGVAALEGAGAAVPDLATVAIAGSAGGWISAVGGAWKDGPIEGFEWPKFFRSPLISFAYALLIAHFTAEPLLILLGALGYTVATIETYKTFFFPNKPRGKFAGKPVLYPEMLRRRQRFVPLYIAIWAAVLVCMGIALAGESRGLLG
ncbi:MAG: hypothetical protein HY561_08605 [Gemmatimonadetes bacterium]|nr:hypothetical protein [Gemmatimonadota bacterium]